MGMMVRRHYASFVDNKAEGSAKKVEPSAPVKEVKAKKTTTVKRTSKLVYKVTLKGKKVIKNKKVTLKLNGKKYTA
jgi:hypothetical protein